jgi:hypothetical protein
MKTKIDVDKLAWQGNNPPFEVRGWESVLRQRKNENASSSETAIDPKTMCRHFLFKGETGSGKTCSGMKPAIRSVLEYPDGDTLHQPSRDSRAGALVIDPKGDLSGWIQREFGWHGDGEESSLFNDRLLVIQPTSHRIVDFFENEDVGEMSAPELQKMLYSILPASATTDYGDKSFFIQQTAQLLQGLLAVDSVLFKADKTGEKVEAFWHAVTFAIIRADKKREQDRQSRIPGLRQRPNSSGGAEAESQAANRLPPGLDAGKEQSCEKQPTLTVDRANYFARYVDFLSANNRSDRKWPIYFDCAAKFGVEAKVFACLVQHTNSPAEQNGGVIGTVMNKIAPLTDEKLRSLVWLNPFQRPDPAKTVAMKAIFDHGKVVVYKTSTSGLADECFGRALKRIFMDMTYHLKRPSKRPVAYICDEFHRYITMDEESGEQNFLDSCRAFRAIAILATQSDSSILQSLQAQQNKRPQFALNVLMNNTGTKMIFRTQDQNTTEQLKAIFAEPPTDRRPHIMNVRPPSTLATGECYFSTPHPSEGRARISRACGLLDLVDDLDGHHVQSVYAMNIPRHIIQEVVRKFYGSDQSNGRCTMIKVTAKELAERLSGENPLLDEEIDRNQKDWHQRFLCQTYGLRVWKRDAKAVLMTCTLPNGHAELVVREIAYHHLNEEFALKTMAIDFDLGEFRQE